jgi:putative ABC transport system permease protein
METFLQDIRYGFRTLIKKPGFTAVAVMALVLGIGANTAIFSVVNAVLLRPLPYKDPDQIMMVFESRPQRGIAKTLVTLPEFLDWRSRNQAFQDMVAFDSLSQSRTDGGGPQRVISFVASPNVFSMLGVEAALGRTFRPEEERFGDHHVIVLTDGYWKRQFGADPNVLNRALTLDGESYTIVGVLPPGFRFPLENVEADFWRPLSYRNENLEDLRGEHTLRIIARLKPGVSVEQAQAEMNLVTGAIAQQYPKSNTDHGATVISMHEQVVGKVRPALFVLLGAVGFVLLIACANVANLLLARATARQKEVAIRVAIGASRPRLIRQFLTESVLLALVGGMFGLLLALWGVDLLLANSPGDIPRLKDVGLDWRVLAFTVSATLLTGLVFGLAPALQASKTNLNEALKEGGRTSGGAAARQRVRSLFVVIQVALALVLLIGAGLLIRSFMRLRQVDPGFDPENVLTMNIAMPESKYPTSQQQTQFLGELLRRIKNVPGVEHASAVEPLPLSSSDLVLSFVIQGQPPADPGAKTSANWRTVGPDYFHTMNIPLARGRYFTEQDDERSQKVIIINQSMAERYFPDKDPLGQQLTIGYNRATCEIVGVVGDVRHLGLDTEAGAEMYTPFSQTPWEAMSLVLRTSSEPASVVAAVRGQVESLDSEMPVSGVRTMETILSNSVASPRFNMMLLAIFAAVALVLAAVGIYGVISYSVTQRTHEIGIRMALGAKETDVLRMVVGQGMVLAMIGVAAGLAGAFAVTRLMSKLLYGVSTTDPATFALISLLLVAVAVVSSYIPARRATRVDPMVALRYE